jgi:nucleotide-binding universal stress UspA family protein
MASTPRDWANINERAVGRFDFDQCAQMRMVPACVENNGSQPVRTLLAATDGSAHADRAVRLAGELAGATGASLHLVTVADEPGAAIRKFADAESTSVGDVIEGGNRAKLCHARQIATDAGAKEIHQHSIVGDAATENILAVIQRVKADAVVVGRRGRGRLGGLLLGSVSQKLAALAPCAVIIVP